MNVTGVTIADVTADVDVMWIVLCGSMVMFMQAGFALLESGAVRKRNVQNILFKNFMDCCWATIAFFFLGYGFAFGTSDGTDSPFIGSGNFALSLEPSNTGYHMFFFQWAFSNAAATIVSGSVAERTKLEAFFAYATIITGLVYPVVCHWFWDSDGFASAFNTNPLFGTGVIDFAGSGVVHTVGGLAGLVGAYIVGPRKGCFPKPGEPAQNFEPASYTNMGIGVFILWFGWYGFNCGSTLAIVGLGGVAAHVAVTTTIAAATGGLFSTIIVKIQCGFWDLGICFNGILAGLISITAGCSVVQPWAAFVIGILASFCYIAASALLKRLRIDDPLDAAPLHGFCGTLGVICAAIFADAELYSAAYGTGAELVDGWKGRQIAANCVGQLCVVVWTLVACGISYKIVDILLKKCMSDGMGVRCTEEAEMMGLDQSEHGASRFFGVSRRTSRRTSTTPLKKGKDEVTAGEVELATKVAAAV